MMETRTSERGGARTAHRTVGARDREGERDRCRTPPTHRAGGAALRGGASRRLRRDGARRRDALRRAGRAGARRHPLRAGDLLDRGAAGGLREAAARALRRPRDGQRGATPAPGDDGRAGGTRRRLRRDPLPPGPAGVAVHAAHRHAHGADPARAARPRLRARAPAPLRIGAARVDQRRPATRGGGPRPDLGGHRPQRPRPRATTGTCPTTRTAISASWAGSLTRRGR